MSRHGETGRNSGDGERKWLGDREGVILGGGWEGLTLGARREGNRPLGRRKEPRRGGEEAGWRIASQNEKERKGKEKNGKTKAGKGGGGECGRGSSPAREIIARARHCEMRDAGGESGVERNPRGKTKGSVKDGSLFWGKDYVGGEPSRTTPQERRSADDLRGEGATLGA